MEDTLAACVTGYTQTWVDEDLFDRLQFDEATISLNVTGIHGTQSTSRQAGQVTIGPANSLKSKRKQLTVNSQKNPDFVRIKRVQCPSDEAEKPISEMRGI